jgi:hypothetical protein
MDKLKNNRIRWYSHVLKMNNDRTLTVLTMKLRGKHKEENQTRDGNNRLGKILSCI